MERNLLRVSPAWSLHRSFAIRTLPDGRVDHARPPCPDDFADEEEWTPKYDHWWAFAVDPVSHRLEGNARAVFEAVARRPVDLQAGADGIGGADRSPAPTSSAGRSRACPDSSTCCGQGPIFVNDGPRADVNHPLSGRPRTGSSGCAAARRCRVRCGAAVPRHRGRSRTTGEGGSRQRPHRGRRRVLRGSTRGDEPAPTHPAPHPVVVGDRLARGPTCCSAAEESLPADLRRQADRLRRRARRPAARAVASGRRATDGELPRSGADDQDVAAVLGRRARRRARCPAAGHRAGRRRARPPTTRGSSTSPMRVLLDLSASPLPRRRGGAAGHGPARLRLHRRAGRLPGDRPARGLLSPRTSMTSPASPGSCTTSPTWCRARCAATQPGCGRPSRTRWEPRAAGRPTSARRARAARVRRRAQRRAGGARGQAPVPAHRRLAGRGSLSPQPSTYCRRIRSTTRQPRQVVGCANASVDRRSVGGRPLRRPGTRRRRRARRRAPRTTHRPGPAGPSRGDSESSGSSGRRGGREQV